MLPFGGKFAQGEAKALAGKIRTAVFVNDDETAKLDDEFEAFGRSSPAIDGDESIHSAFRIVFVGALPENMSGGTTGFGVVLLVENGAQLADF